MSNKILEILNNNRTWPIIITGMDAKNFPTSVVLSASCPSENLSGENATWLKEIFEKSKNPKPFLLVINKIDSTSEEEQQKFYEILKYKSTNGIKFPNNMQIVITADDIEKISTPIKSLCLIYKAEN